MSENMSVVERFVSLLTAEDMVLRMNDEALLKEGTDALEEAAWLDFELVMVGPDPTFRAEFKGVEGFVEGWRDWVSPFDSVRLEISTDELIENGDRIVSPGRMTASPKGTDAEVATETAAVITFEDGKIRRIELHLDRGTALRAAGLEP